MKLRVFYSRDGDCLLVIGADKKAVLADGGRASTYSKHVGKNLSQLAGEGIDLETVYVSHIDADHVEGVEKMLRDMVEWAAHEFRLTTEDGADISEPDVPNVKKPKAFWHNAFDDQIDKKKADNVSNALAASAAVFTGLTNSAPPEVRKLAAEISNLAYGERQALNISKKLRNDLLNIKLNPPAKGKVMVLNDTGALPPAITVGGMSWRIIGPTQGHLDVLEKQWDEWLASANGDLKKIEDEIAGDKSRIGNSTGEVSMIVRSRASEAENLAQAFLTSDFALSKAAKDRDGVTVPNVASLMFMVEEKKKRVLMTGDGHWKDIESGLKRQGLFDAKGNLHVDVLKMPHHGETHNISRDFLKRVTADKYLFCGISGPQNNNPEVETVEYVLDSRLKKDHQGTHAKVKSKFELFFNGSSTHPDLSPAAAGQIAKIEALLAARATPSRFKVTFLDASSFGGSFFEINV